MIQIFRRETGAAIAAATLALAATSTLEACDPAPRIVTIAAAPPASSSLGKAPSKKAPRVKLPSLANGASHISVEDLLEFLRLATGQPVIRVATPTDDRQRGPQIARSPLTSGMPIPLVSSKDPLTVPVVKALLAANGIGVEPFVIEGNVSVLLVREDAKALAKIGQRTALRGSPAGNTELQMAHVDAEWSIDPSARGWIILDLEHASSSDLQRVIDRMVNERTLRVMEIGSHGQLLLDGPGDVLTRAVELVRFLDKPEIWQKSSEEKSSTPNSGAQRNKSEQSEAKSRGSSNEVRSNRGVRATSQRRTAPGVRTRSTRAVPAERGANPSAESTPSPPPPPSRVEPPSPLPPKREPTAVPRAPKTEGERAPKEERVLTDEAAGFPESSHISLFSSRALALDLRSVQPRCGPRDEI